jgi:molecular chaperone DnaK (HSP70)
VNPDEAIVYGTTVQAAIVAGRYTRNEPVIIEIASHSLGIETIGGVMNPLIERQTTVPTKKARM